MASYWKRLFWGMQFFMISICGAESQFNDGTNKGYHLLIHHKELEQLKAFVHEKMPLLKLPQNRKKASNTAIMEKKDK